MNQQTQTNLKMPVKVSDGIDFKFYHEVIHIVANEKHCQVYIENQVKPINCLWTISVLKEILPSNFFMCHRSNIINLDHLQKLEKDNRTIHLTDDHVITMAETHVDEFMERMNIPRG